MGSGGFTRVKETEHEADHSSPSSDLVSRSLCMSSWRRT
jgi:hypothetical protein